MTLNFDGCFSSGVDIFDGLRVGVYFGGVLRVLYTGRSRADSRVWTMSVSSCGMVDDESEGS